MVGAYQLKLSCMKCNKHHTGTTLHMEGVSEQLPLSTDVT